MPRNITVTFGDGSSHVYQNAPDTLSPQDVAARAAADFGGKAVTNIDGGNPAPAAPAAEPAPSLMDSVMGSIKSAASNVADVASGFADSAVHALTTVGHGLDMGDAATTGTLTPAPIAPPPPDIDALSAPFQTPDSQKTPAQLASEKAIASQPPPTYAVDIDQGAARRRAWDDVPQNPLQAGYNEAAGRAGKTLGNAMTTAGEAIDSEDLRTAGRQYQAAADARINRAMQGNEDSDTVKTVAGVFSLAPLLGGPAGIGSMVTQAGVDGYADARQAGDSPGEAISRGTAMALANYVGLRVQVPGLTGALTKAVSGAPAGQAVAALGHALTTNVGGMEATTVLGDLYDKMAPGGLKPDMSASDMVSDIADTAKSAALLTLAVPGLPLAAGHLFHAAHALAHGQGSADVASAIGSATPPAADATPTTSADNTAAAPPAPNFSAPVGLDTLHNSIDEAARTVGLTPKATAALRDAAAQQDPQDAPAFVARAFHRFEANGLTTKPGAPGAFRDALAQRIADLQPDEPPAAPAPAAAAAPSVADQLTAIRPLDRSTPAPATTPAEEAAAPAEPAPITPTAMAQANDIAAQAHEAATSPFNDTPEPTDAQKAAGNYKLGHVNFQGLDVSIENPQGSTRSGVDPDGKPWQNEMAAHYGYLRGTSASDGDHVDTFIGPNPESKTAYVIDQVDPDTGKFDEPKTILGADSEQQARELYAANYADGWNGLGAITPLPMDAFKAWVRDGVKDKPLGDITQWKPTDERAQPDVAEPSSVPAGAGDGGGGPAVASGGDLGQDAAVPAGGGVGRDAAAPAGGAGASAAVDAGGKPEPALTSQSTEPFYSQLHRSLSGLNMRAGDAGAWRQALKGAMGKGVKAEEIAHSGIEDWLNMQTGKVTKQQMLDYLDGNGVKVTETMLGGNEHYRDANGQRVLDDSGGFVRSATAPKFEGYTLPGGKNYRELLLTLPAKDSISERHVAVPAGWGDTDGGNVGVERQGDNRRDFRAGHWDQPNVLAHVRFNDRVDADGKKVLFIEEVQSDWGQSGKKRGFRDQQEAELNRLVAERDSAPDDATSEAAQAKINALGRQEPGVPSGPFVGKTEAWLSLAIKRMAKYAVDHGYDRVAFTNGEQNADRYDLSKSIDKLTYANEGDGTFSLMAEKDGKPLRGMSNLIVSEADLEAHVGKDVAQRMVNGDGKAIPGGPEKELSGLDLKVGGGGMKTFYDKIVPSVAKEVVRKLGGDGLKQVSIGTPDSAADNFNRYAGPERSLGDVEAMYELSRKSGPGIYDNPLTGRSETFAINRVMNEQSLKKVVALMKAGTSFERAVIDHDVSVAVAELMGGRVDPVPESERRDLYTPQPGFDITDKMRATAADGVPLFKQSGDRPSAKGVDPVALRAEVSRIQAGWKDTPPVHVVDDVNGLPDHIQDSLRSMGAEGKTRALLMPGRGSDPGDVYLIASRLKDLPAAQAALFHEVLGHYGIRKVLGSDAIYSAEMYKLRQANPALASEAEAWMQAHGRGAIAARVERGLSMDQAMKSVRALSTEEALADRAGRGEPIRGLQSLMAKIQAWLRSVGLHSVADHLESMTQAETAALLARARSTVEATEPSSYHGDELAPALSEGDDKAAPLLSQHTADDEAPKEQAPAGHAAAALARVRDAGAKFADTMTAIRDDALLKTVPMALGTSETRTIAKDFANADRLARWQWGKFDDVLKKNYDEAQRRAMWEAGDQESVLRQQGKTPGPTEGLNRLTPDERKTVETLQSYGDSLLKRAQDVGMFQGEGLPSWTPRMAVLVDGKGEFSRPKGGGAETGAKQGRNIVTSASSLKARKYLTAEDTEAAMKGKLGDGAQLVRDIRTMPLAMARLERAIAGRELVNNIKAMGQRAGLETVSKTDEPGFFTVDHPAFKTWQATTDEDDTKSWEAKPLYVNKAFQGPLKAVMSETPGPVYSALMSLKAKSMGLIMYSPLIHNAVEWGRALPAMPGKVATFQIYFEGNRIKNDPEQMRQAINDGLVPIGRRGGIQDITGIMEDPSLKPGRSWTAKLIGGALGVANEKAGVMAKKGIDAAGDFWHNTLLWDRVGDLQAGLYGALREKEIQKGTDPAAAGKLAAHFANRFAGALPNEAMSAGARKVANILMFSRTFTLGNLGLMKDMVTGLPRDIQSQIRTASGDLAAAAATSRARRIAIASFIVDIGLMYVGNSILQSTIEHLKGKKSWGEVGQGYLDRLHKLLARTGDHPLETLSNPFDMANSLSSTSANEPGKEDRVRVGTQDDGTAIYLRLPTGKVGEDFKNWITKPLVTAKAKESQLVRPLQQVWSNDNGIGQRIYDPDAKGIGGVLSNAGKIAKLFATQAIPADAIQGALDWKNGKASDVDKLKVAGPLAGLTFSKGAPGGPAVGQMYDADRRFEGAKMDVMPDVKAAIKAGDDDKAIALLEGIKMQPSEIMRVLRHLEMPESRLSAGAFKHFAQHASDDDMERMNDLLGAEKAREPAPAQP